MIKIMVDSSSDYREEGKTELFIPMSVNIDGKEYKDGIDLDNDSSVRLKNTDYSITYVESELTGSTAILLIPFDSYADTIMAWTRVFFAVCVIIIITMIVWNYAVQQFACVFIRWFVDHIFCFTFLHYDSILHYHDPVTDHAYKCEIM